jgi:hypothetical protein
MSELNRIFSNWTQRCSGISNITSSAVTITETQLANLEKLQQRVIDSIDNPKLALTDNMKKDLAELKAKRDAPDELPKGAKTHLDKVFNKVFWKKERLEIDNKYTNKGKLNEEDVLDLHSKVDGGFYIKNKERFYNEFIEGEPDNFDLPNPEIQIVVRDAKANFDKETFDAADLIENYIKQLNGYSWLLKDNFNLDYFPKGELCYGLTNSPVHTITNEITTMFYKLGNPDSDNDKWKEVRKKIERNHIHDIAKFKLEYPSYVFENENLDFDIPYWMRVKKFEVITTQEDVDFIKQRVLMSKIYLVNKEIETLKQMRLL